MHGWAQQLVVTGHSAEPAWLGRVQPPACGPVGLLKFSVLCALVPSVRYKTPREMQDLALKCPMRMLIRSTFGDGLQSPFKDGR